MNNMHKYIGGPVQINIMMLLLKKEIQTDSKLVYLDSMETRVWFQPDLFTQFGEVIAQYKSWHHLIWKWNYLSLLFKVFISIKIYVQTITDVLQLKQRFWVNLCVLCLKEDYLNLLFIISNLKNTTR